MDKIYALGSCDSTFEIRLILRSILDCSLFTDNKAIQFHAHADLAGFLPEFDVPFGSRLTWKSKETKMGGGEGEGRREEGSMKERVYEMRFPLT